MYSPLTLKILDYGESEYVNQFGLIVDEAAGPLRIQGRVLHPPTLKFCAGSKQPTIVRRFRLNNRLNVDLCIETCKWRLEHARLL